MKGLKCVKCGKTAKPARLRLEETEVPGWKCSCGEEYLDTEAVERLLAIRRLAEENLNARVTRQGNSFAVRLPIAVFKAFGLKDKENLRISIDAANPDSFTLSTN